MLHNNNSSAPPPPWASGSHQYGFTKVTNDMWTSAHSAHSSQSPVVFRHKEYPSASAALDDYIYDFEGRSRFRKAVAARLSVDQLLLPQNVERTPAPMVQTLNASAAPTGASPERRMQEERLDSVRQMVDQAYKLLLRDQRKKQQVAAALNDSQILLERISRENITSFENDASFPNTLQHDDLQSMTTDLLLTADPLTPSKKPVRKQSSSQLRENKSQSQSFLGEGTSYQFHPIVERQVSSMPYSQSVHFHDTRPPMSLDDSLLRKSSMQDIDYSPNTKRVLSRLRNLQQNQLSKAKQKELREKQLSSSDNLRQTHKQSDSSDNLRRTDSLSQSQKDVSSEEKSKFLRGPPSWVQDLARSEISSVAMPGMAGYSAPNILQDQSHQGAGLNLNDLSTTSYTQRRHSLPSSSIEDLLNDSTRVREDLRTKLLSDSQRDIINSELTRFGTNIDLDQNYEPLHNTDSMTQSRLLLREYMSKMPDERNIPSHLDLRFPYSPTARNDSTLVGDTTQELLRKYAPDSIAYETPVKHKPQSQAKGASSSDTLSDNSDNLLLKPPMSGLPSSTPIRKGINMNQADHCASPLLRHAQGGSTGFLFKPQEGSYMNGAEGSNAPVAEKHQLYLQQLQRAIEESGSSVVTQLHDKLGYGASYDHSSLKSKGVTFQIPDSQDNSTGDADDNEHSSFLERIRQLLSTPPPTSSAAGAVDSATSPDTEIILSGDRPWEQVGSAFKKPKYVTEKTQTGDAMKKANLVDDFLEDCLKTTQQEEERLSGHDQPGSMEALKNILFTVQSMVPPGDSNQDDTSNTETDMEVAANTHTQSSHHSPQRGQTDEGTPYHLTESWENRPTDSLKKAMKHLSTLKSLVQDQEKLMNPTYVPNSPQT